MVDPALSNPNAPIDHSAMIFTHSEKLNDLKHDTERIRNNVHKIEGSIGDILSKLDRLTIGVADIRETTKTVTLKNGNGQKVTYCRDDVIQLGYDTMLDYKDFKSEFERFELKKKKNWKVIGLIVANASLLLGILLTLIQVLQALHK